MPLSKAGKKIMRNLKEEYGEEKGEDVFYGMENKGKIPGMKPPRKKHQPKNTAGR